MQGELLRWSKLIRNVASLCPTHKWWRKTSATSAALWLNDSHDQCHPAGRSRERWSEVAFFRIFCLQKEKQVYNVIIASATKKLKLFRMRFSLKHFVVCDLAVELRSSDLQCWRFGGVSKVENFHLKTNLVSGWTTYLKKYYSQIGSNWIMKPQVIRGEHKKIFELPPASHSSSSWRLSILKCP